MATNDDLWAQMTDPIRMPLVDSIPGMLVDNPALSGAATPPILQVQLHTLGGKNLLLQLTEKAAKQLVEAIAISLQLRDSQLEPGSDGPTKVH